MYPAVPGTGEFVPHAPRFTKAVVHLENGKDIVIKAEAADVAKTQVVQRIRSGWRSKAKDRIELAELVSGTTLEVDLHTLSN
jgi:putative alpha-1,2-mannosidase